MVYDSSGRVGVARGDHLRDADQDVARIVRRGQLVSLHRAGRSSSARRCGRRGRPGGRGRARRRRRSPRAPPPPPARSRWSPPSSTARRASGSSTCARPVSIVRRSASAFAQASISTSPVRASCATTGTRPRSSSFTWSIHDMVERARVRECGSAWGMRRPARFRSFGAERTRGGEGRQPARDRDEPAIGRRCFPTRWSGSPAGPTPGGAPAGWCSCWTSTARWRPSSTAPSSPPCRRRRGARWSG